MAWSELLALWKCQIHEARAGRALRVQAKGSIPIACGSSKLPILSAGADQLAQTSWRRPADNFGQDPLAL